MPSPQPALTCRGLEVRASRGFLVNTRRAYAGALRRLDAWRGAAPVDAEKFPG